jgi:hypothetical protein
MEASFSRLFPLARLLSSPSKPDAAERSSLTDTQSSTREFNRARKTCICLTD